MSNRTALKILSTLNVDAQFVQQIGYKIFNGQPTEQNTIDFQNCLTDVMSEAQSLLQLVQLEAQESK